MKLPDMGRLRRDRVTTGDFLGFLSGRTKTGQRGKGRPSREGGKQREKEAMQSEGEGGGGGSFRGLRPTTYSVFWAAALGTESHPWSSEREEEGTAPFPRTRREGGRSKRRLHPSQNAARKGEEEK